jgi:hypothetical protein
VIEHNVERALELAEDCHAAFVAATPTASQPCDSPEIDA